MLTFVQGDNTMIGSIASLAAGSGEAEMTLLEKEVHRFVKFIAIIAVISAIIFFVIGMGRGRPFIFSFVNGKHWPIHRYFVKLTISINVFSIRLPVLLNDGLLIKLNCFGQDLSLCSSPTFPRVFPPP